MPSATERRSERHWRRRALTSILHAQPLVRRNGITDHMLAATPPINAWARCLLGLPRRLGGRGLARAAVAARPLVGADLKPAPAAAPPVPRAACQPTRQRRARRAATSAPARHAAARAQHREHPRHVGRVEPGLVPHLSDQGATLAALDAAGVVQRAPHTVGESADFALAVGCCAGKGHRFGSLYACYDSAPEAEKPEGRESGGW